MHNRHLGMAGDEAAYVSASSKTDPYSWSTLVASGTPILEVVFDEREWPVCDQNSRALEELAEMIATAALDAHRMQSAGEADFLHFLTISGLAVGGTILSYY